MKWISVKERLPSSKSNDVLVTDCEACTVAYYNRASKEWDFFRPLEDTLWVSEEVTHWMPLPKKPKA
jgi:hypothetical protein